MTLMLLIKYLIMNPSDKNVDKTKLWKSLYECVMFSFFNILHLHQRLRWVFHSERSEAEGRVESRELCWKRRKWMKKKGTTTTTTATFFVPPYLPCKFEKKFQFLKKILKRIKNFWTIKLCKKNSIRCHFLLGISYRNFFWRFPIIVNLSVIFSKDL